jgi:putative phosphoribosyl transferase
MHAAVTAARQWRPARVVVAVPVAAPSVCEEFRQVADEVICLETPDPFHAVSLWYSDFRQTTDEEIRELLDQSTLAEAGGQERTVSIPMGGVTLEGNLAVPGKSRGIVLFAHGSGSSRHSPRNRKVARGLREAGMATLLIDLLSPAEEELDLLTAHLRFDISLLAERLIGATDWLLRQEETRNLPIGYFGASTGAAAALAAAAQRPKAVRAVVSRGGRPDLAGPALSHVQAPTLLIVGGEDYPVIRLNQQAMEQLKVETRLQIVPGAGHLFEEPSTLEQVAHFAARWFNRYLTTERVDVA